MFWIERITLDSKTTIFLENSPVTFDATNHSLFWKSSSFYVSMSFHSPNFASLPQFLIIVYHSKMTFYLLYLFLSSLSTVSTLINFWCFCFHLYIHYPVSTIINIIPNVFKLSTNLHFFPSTCFKVNPRHPVISPVNNFIYIKLLLKSKNCARKTFKWVWKSQLGLPWWRSG